MSKDKNHDEQGLPFAETVSYWKSGSTNPDAWIEKTAALITKFGGAVLGDLLLSVLHADVRFFKGQRVRLSRKGQQQFRLKRGVQTARVTRVDNGFSIHVLIDGYKQPKRFHHSFFEPIPRKR